MVNKLNKQPFKSKFILKSSRLRGFYEIHSKLYKCISQLMINNLKEQLFKPKFT